LSDKIGYTRKRNRAWGIVDALFEKESDVTFKEVIDALKFLVPTQQMTFETYENGEVTLVDLGQRILKINTNFMPLMTVLFPWEQNGEQIIKRVPVGSRSREFDLAQLAFWNLYGDAEKPEREQAATMPPIAGLRL
jgi:hypothetical protein